MQQNEPDDYVIASGNTRSVRDFCIKVAEWFGYDLIFKGKGYDEIGFYSKSNKVLIRIDPKCFRPTEVDLLLGDSSKAKKILNWEPKISFDELVNEMCETDNQLCKKNN